MKESLKGAMERNFRPEFLNRCDDIIVFRSLTKDDLGEIVDIELIKVAKRLKDKNLILMVNPEARDFLIEKGTSLDFGARPLRRAIENFLEDPLSEDLLRGAFGEHQEIHTKVLTDEKGEKRIAFDTVDLIKPEESTPEPVVTASV